MTTRLWTWDSRYAQGHQAAPCTQPGTARRRCDPALEVSAVQSTPWGSLSQRQGVSSPGLGKGFPYREHFVDVYFVIPRSWKRRQWWYWERKIEKEERERGCWELVNKPWGAEGLLPHGCSPWSYSRSFCTQLMSPLSSMNALQCLWVLGKTKSSLNVMIVY